VTSPIHRKILVPIIQLHTNTAVTFDFSFQKWDVGKIKVNQPIFKSYSRSDQVTRNELMGTVAAVPVPATGRYFSCLQTNSIKALKCSQEHYWIGCGWK